MVLQSLGRVAAAAVFAFAACAARAAEFSDGQKTEIRAIIKDYLVANPDVMRDALVEVDKRAKAEEVSAREQAVGDQAAVIFDSKRQAVVGNPNGKVTLVEFFDYNCGYCKKAVGDLTQLMKANPDLRVVLKDFPVLGPGSVEAAQIATAARNQLKGDRFWEFHQKLLATRGQIGKAQALGVAKEFGVDMDRLAKDAADPETRASIKETMTLADGLSLTGTPSYVVGRDIIVGAVGYDELSAKLSNVRRCGKAACS